MAKVKLVQRGRRMPTRKGEPAKYSEPTKEDIERTKKLKQEDEAFFKMFEVKQQDPSKVRRVA